MKKLIILVILLFTSNSWAICTTTQFNPYSGKLDFCEEGGGSGGSIDVKEGGVTTNTGTLTAIDFQGGFDTTGATEVDVSLDLSEVVTGDITFSTNAATIATNAVGMGTDTTGNFVNRIVGGDGISSTGASTGENIEHTLSVDLEDADAGGATTGSASGLEFVNTELTLLQGCSDNQILQWDDTLGRWQCQTAGAGTGDVESVGDCTGGACNDGTSDGGGYIRLWDGDSHYGQLDTVDLSGNVTINIPNTSGTISLITATETLTNKTLTAAANVIEADTVTVVDGTDATSFVAIFDSATGSLPVKTDGGLLYAADTGTLSATVLTEGANAVFNSSETPGGELGGTWGSPTIDDGLSVGGWTLTGTTTLSGTIDASSTGNIKILTATTLPANCANGEIGYDSDATSGQRFYICESGTWVLQGDGGGGSSAGYIFLNPGSANITGTMALVGDATQGAQIDGSNGFVLLFDATTDEGAAYRVRLPDNWASHTDLKLMYSMVSGTANEVEWEAAVMCQTAGDSERDDADGFAAIAVASDTVPGTIYFPDTVTITLTDDSCAASDLMTLFISTDADDATSDDATGDRRLIGIIYEYGI